MHLPGPCRFLVAATLGLLLCAPLPGAAKPPAWDKRIDGKKRFKILKAFDGQAVLDKETGLVWERAPDPVELDWDDANNYCLREVIGGRGGWRLPRLEELSSLIDPISRMLPTDHPFDVPGEVTLFWTATTTITNVGDNTTASVGQLGFEGTSASNRLKDSLDLRAWCVRGSAGVDGG